MKFLRALFRFLRNPEKFKKQSALMVDEGTFWYAEAVSWHALYFIRLNAEDYDGAYEAREKFQFARHRHNMVCDEHKKLVGY
jgi:hypothetical protein